MKGHRSRAAIRRASTRASPGSGRISSPRSRGFSDFLLGELRAAFPDPFDHLDADQLYRAINIVEPSLIRAEADEVTYNLHVMLRFDLEADMLEGRLAVKDLPEAWNARMESDLGIRPLDDRDGCLQDVHWFFWRHRRPVSGIHDRQCARGPILPGGGRCGSRHSG